METEINSKVAAVRRRMVNNAIFRSLAFWLMVGSLTAIVFSLLRLATAGAVPAWLAVASLFALFLVGIVGGFRGRRVSMSDAARAIDDRYDSKDTITTALAFAAGGARDFIHEPLIKDARELAGRVRAGDVAPLRFPRYAWRCLGLLVAAILLIVFPVSLAVRQPRVFDEPDVILIGARPPAERTPLPKVTRELTENSLRALSSERSSNRGPDRLASMADRDIVRSYFQSTQSRR